MADKEIVVVLGADISSLTRAMAMAQAQVGATASIIDREMNSAEKSVSKNTSTMSQSMQNMKNNWTNALTGIQTALKTTLISSIPALIPVLASATTTTLALGGAFVSAGTGIAGFGAVAVGVLGKVFSASTKLAQAQDAIDKAKTPKERANAYKLQAQALAGLDSEQRKALTALQGFKTFWGGFTKQFETPVVNIFTKGIGVFQTVLTKMQPAINGAMKAVSGLVDGMKASLGTTDIKKFFDWINKTAGQNITSFGIIFGNVFRGVADLLVAFSPMSNGVMGSIVGMTQKFADWSSTLSQSKGFQQFVDYVKTNTPVVTGLIGNILSIVGNLVVILAPLGQATLDVINKILGGLNTFTGKIKTAFSSGTFKSVGDALLSIIPPSFQGVLSNAQNIVSDFKLALSSSDWGMIGVAIGTAIGNAIQGIKGLGQKLSDNVVSEFNTIDWSGMATQLQSGISGFAISLANMISTNLGTSLSSGDWSQVGKSLGDIIGTQLGNLLQNATKYTGQLGQLIIDIFNGIDWATVGANAVVGIAGFIIGFVAALLDIGTWLKVIMQYWKPLLLAIIGLLFLPESWLGKIGIALAKIPFVGKLLEWLWTGFMKLIAPLGVRLQGWFGEIGKNFLNGWKRMFDSGTILGDWLGKLGTIWTNIWSWFTGKLASLNTKIQVFADGAGNLLAKPFKWMADQAGQFIGKVVSGVQSIWTKVSDIAGRVKTAVGNMFSGIKTPHFSVTGSMNPMKWASEGMPKINVSWHANGGIIKGTNGGTVVGVGENGGDEAILPLSNKSKMLPFALAVASMMPQQKADTQALNSEITINVPLVIDGREIAKATVKFNQEELNNLQKKQNRKVGQYS